MALLLPFHLAPSPTGAAHLTCKLTCTADPGTEAAITAEVCDDVLQTLRMTWPDEDFTLVASPADAPSLLVQILRADRSGLAIRLTWTLASGQRIEGETHAVSAMDRRLSRSMRRSLLRNALLATPKPG